MANISEHFMLWEHSSQGQGVSLQGLREAALRGCLGEPKCGSLMVEFDHELQILQHWYDQHHWGLANLKLKQQWSVYLPLNLPNYLLKFKTIVNIPVFGFALWWITVYHSFKEFSLCRNLFLFGDLLT